MMRKTLEDMVAFKMMKKIQPQDLTMAELELMETNIFKIMRACTQKSQVFMLISVTHK